MSTDLPIIIQGGMGAGVSGWCLAQAVSKLGQLGVVAGTALDEMLARRLQEGDLDGHVRRALEQFPFRKMAQRILDKYFVPGGKSPDAPYQTRKMPGIESHPEAHEMCIAGNFVEVFLAREGHNNPVGINYLEKIQFPHLPAIYGAILAGVTVIIMGAGLPIEIPAVIEALTSNQPAVYTPYVVGAPHGTYRMHFDPSAFMEDAPLPTNLRKPIFLPIVSSVTIATVLLRKTGGKLDGFVVENATAGGHNAPPRGAAHMTPDGQPIYGPRDVIDVPAIRKLGLPFWMAGGYGAPERVRAAIDQGAAGVQVGTPFALCRESSLEPTARRTLINMALAGKGRIFTDPVASPTGFPFKVACLAGTLSDQPVYDRRRRNCDLGFLREAYVRPDGGIGYRCPAEPAAAYTAKGGKPENMAGRKCLCNALVANIGMPQIMANGERDKCLVTLGDDYVNIGRFCTLDQPDYSAADVIRVLLQA